MAEARICSRLSKTWSGVCLNSGNCDRQCRNLEGAVHGACHRKGWGFACFCYPISEFEIGSSSEAPSEDESRSSETPALSSSAWNCNHGEYALRLAREHAYCRMEEESEIRAERTCEMVLIVVTVVVQLLFLQHLLL
ncbi:defensin-like protein 1 [Forsythia ovata]|uniref:Defensin-like protein 1 n=1 Tax=Forsythia ovata TaxID=205694 RepID=A0ABD1P454_9LAMI